MIMNGITVEWPGCRSPTLWMQQRKKERACDEKSPRLRQIARRLVLVRRERACVGGWGHLSGVVLCCRQPVR